MMGGRPPIPYVQAGGGVPGYAGRLINPMAMGGPGPMPPMPAALPPGGPPMPGMTPAGTPMPGPPAGAFQGYGAPLMNRFNNPPPGYTAGNAIV